jgi:nucleoside-diphosphate-sugar epimerase
VTSLGSGPAARERTCVVTGAAGFVGRAIVRRLLAEGNVVRAIVLRDDPQAEALLCTHSAPGAVEIIPADVTDYESIAPAFAGAARVFHTAALVHAWAPRAQFDAVNVGGTRNAARAAFAHGVDRFVHISTTDVFGIPKRDEVLDETSPFRPWNEPYADSKIEAERWLWQLHRSGRLPLTVIYPGWVYGPGDSAFFPGLAAAIAGGFMCFWKRDVRLPWVYVDNLAEACVLAGTGPRAIGQGYIVHDGPGGPTLQEVCARIAQRLDFRPPTRHVPFAAALAAARLLQLLWKLTRRKGPPPLLTADVKAFGHEWHLSTDKIRKQLGWSPRVSIEDGMRAALDGLQVTRGKGQAG